MFIQILAIEKSLPTICWIIHFDNMRNHILVNFVLYHNFLDYFLTHHIRQISLWRSLTNRFCDTTCYNEFSGVVEKKSYRCEHSNLIFSMTRTGNSSQPVSQNLFINIHKYRHLSSRQSGCKRSSLLHEHHNNCSDIGNHSSHNNPTWKRCWTR